MNGKGQVTLMAYGKDRYGVRAELCSIISNIRVGKSAGGSWG